MAFMNSFIPKWSKDWMFWGYPGTPLGKPSLTAWKMQVGNGCFDEGVGAVDNWLGEVILNMAIEKLMI